MFVLLLLPALADPADPTKVRPDKWAQPVPGSTLENFYRVSADLYRSEQSRASDIPDLKALGIKTVFSLRHYHHDSPEFDQAGFVSLQCPMDAGSASAAELVAALRLIRSAPKPVLLHCWHGSDRTGFVVAGYRMIFMNWSAAEAIAELRLGGFGYHEAFYANLLRTLRGLDVAGVRQAVFREAGAGSPVAPEKQPASK